MIKSVRKFSLLGLLALAVSGTPIMLHAQETSTASTNKPAAKASAHSRPLRGKVKAMDSTAMTITVGNTTFQITSQTRITKDGKPATFGDGVVGDNLAAQLKKDADGKWNAVSVNFGAKAKPAAKASNAAKPSNTTTNTP